MRSPTGPPDPGPLHLGRGPRLASLLGPLRALAGEAGAPPPTQHRDLLDLLLDGDAGAGVLVLDLEELPPGDVGLVERLRRARPELTLTLVGGDPAGAVARALLARPASRWWPWPLDVDQLRRLCGEAQGTSDSAPDASADGEPADRGTHAPRPGGASLELDAGVPSAAPPHSAAPSSGSGPRPASGPRPHPLAPTPSRSPLEPAGPGRAAAPAPARTALEEIEAILGGSAAESPATPTGTPGPGARRPDPFDSAGPEAFLDAPQLDGDAELPPTGPSPRTRGEAPALDLPGAAPAPYRPDPDEDFGYPVDDLEDLDDPLELGPLTLDEEELAFLTAAGPDEDEPPYPAPTAAAPSSPSAPASPPAPALGPAPEDERAPRWYRDQVADLADMTQRLELALLRAREAIDETSPEEDVREVEDLQQDVLRLGQFTRTLGYIAAPPARGSQQLDLSVLIEELLAGLPTQLSDTPRLMFRGSEGCLVRSDKSLLGLAFDALLVVAARAAGADEVLRTSVTPGVDRHEVRIAFPPGALSGRSPGDLLLPYALHRLLPGVGPNAVPAAGGILTGQGGDLALERGDDGLLAFVVHLPAEPGAARASADDDGPAAFGPFG